GEEPPQAFGVDQLDLRDEAQCLEHANTLHLVAAFAVADDPAAASRRRRPIGHASPPRFCGGAVCGGEISVARALAFAEHLPPLLGALMPCVSASTPSTGAFSRSCKPTGGSAMSSWRARSASPRHLACAACGRWRRPA